MLISVHFAKKTKKKISNALSGKIVSEETRKKISEHHADFSGENHPMYGKHPSEETRQKMSDAQKKRFSIPENRDLYRKKHAEESKEDFDFVIQSFIKTQRKRRNSRYYISNSKS